MPASRRAAVLVACLAALAAAGCDARGTHAAEGSLERLPPNRWVRIAAPERLPWRRQAHGGAAWDGRRGLLLLFGSDTHGRSHDNAVHAFDPATRRWRDLASAAPPETYRADARGRAVAGPPDAPQPWAMHTFDLVEHDPRLDALWVLGRPEHNPVRKRVAGVREHPPWLFRLATRRWEIFPNDGAPPPRLFGGALAYDSHRDTLVAFSGRAVLELGPDRRRWRRVRPKPAQRLTLHMNAVYAPAERAVFLFGHYREARHDGPFRVRVYHPGPAPYAPGRWEVREPAGRCPPPWQHFPAAWDERARRFLLVVPDRRVARTDRKGRPWYAAARTARTYVYDPRADRCRDLGPAGLPAGAPGHMNYDMVWDDRHGVFLLVTGDWRRPPAVWALRLAL